MNKFSKKMISLISSCLLGASFSGVKGMKLAESESESESEVHIYHLVNNGGNLHPAVPIPQNAAPEEENELLTVSDANTSRIFRSGNQPKLTFKLAWKADRNTYLKDRKRIRKANNGYNVLAEAPYNITNLAVNYPKTAASIVVIPALTLWYLNSNHSNKGVQDDDDYDDEDDLDNNYVQIK